MTILLFTDASTKDGYSCWAYKSTLDNEIVTGIELTANSAAMEILAVIMGIEALERGSEVMVISDYMGVVKTIQEANENRPRYPESEKLCAILGRRLSKLCTIHTIDAIWVASKCPNIRHLEVDQASKKVLQEFLNNRK